MTSGIFFGLSRYGKTEWKEKHIVYYVYFLKKASGLFVYNVTINNNSAVQWRSDLLVKEISINLYKPLTCRKSMANLSYKNVWNNPRLIEDDKKTLNECNFNAQIAKTNNSLWHKIETEPISTENEVSKFNQSTRHPY